MSKYRTIIFAIILAALALRLYNLTYHSLWFDEAISVHWARQDVSRILEVGFTLVEDRLPPLYYLMLKGWATLFGFGEASVRGLSVVFGVLLVPVAAHIADQLFNKRVALVTAGLIALNPFLIWYSQEARMYAPAVFFGTLAIGAFLQLCRSTTALRIIFYTLLFILAATAALYSHLYSAFLLPALGTWLIVTYPRRWQLWLIFAFSGAIITAAYLPILLAIWRFSAEAAPGAPLTGIGQRAGWLLHAFTVWKAPLPASLHFVIPAVTVFFVFLAFLKPRDASLRRCSFGNNVYSPSPPSLARLPLSQFGRGGWGVRAKFSFLVAIWQRLSYALQLRSPLLSVRDFARQAEHISHPRLLITLLLVFPFTIANVLLIRNHLAFFGERYFIVMTPWLLMLVAVGGDNLGHWLDRWHKASGSTSQAMRLLPFAAIFIIALLPIPGQWSVPASKEAWRQSIEQLAQKATPRDGILIHPDWVRYPFQYYFQGPGQTYAAFSQVTSATALDGPLQGVVGDHPVIWLVQSHLDGPDPDRRVEQWLATRYPLVTELYPPGITIKGYAPGYRLDALPPDATPLDITFENRLRLVGYQADQSVSATDHLFHPPSGWVHVTLYWTADQPVAANSTPSVRVIGPEGVWGVNLERPTDALNFYPPSQWDSKTPAIIRHDLDINLNPATPPDVYQLVAGFPDDSAPHLLGQIEVR